MDGAPAGSRLDVLKALGDNTRYAVYLEIARSPQPLSTGDVAESLGLHVNTVRPHLERMREVGLLESRRDTRGAVGRPQNLYQLAPDAPALGLEPPVLPLLSRMLLQVAVDSGADAEVALDAGRQAGRSLAHRGAVAEAPGSCAAALAMLDRLGFDPTWVEEEGRTTVAFGHCPFAELAEAQPNVVCALHRGMLEGVVDEAGTAVVEDFHDLSARVPCQVSLVGT
jgi:predicted ArsR family transcriptional regulator